MLRWGPECVYRLLSETIKIKLYRTIILPVFYVGWNFTSRIIKEITLAQCVGEQGTEKDRWDYQEVPRAYRTGHWERYVRLPGSDTSLQNRALRKIREATRKCYEPTEHCIMKSFITFIPTKHNSGHQIKEDGRGMWHVWDTVQVHTRFS